MITGFIDWTEDSLNLYIFKKQKGEYTLYNIIPSPFEGPLTTSSLAPLLLHGITEWYVSIPLHFLTLREQTFPFSDSSKIRDTLSYELEGILLGNVNDYAVDHIILESSEEMTKVLAVCMERTRLREFIDILSSAGIEPRIITSIDLRISGGMSERFLEDRPADPETRAVTAGDELLNPSLNLRQGELAYTGDIEQFQSNFRLILTLVLLLLIIIGSAATLNLLDDKRETKLLSNEINTLYRKAFPEDKRIADAVRQFKGNLNELKKKKAVLGGVPVLDILNNIANIKKVNLLFDEFTTDGRNIVIKGTAASFKDVESLKDDLSVNFKEVKVMSSDAASDNRINFTIVMQEQSV